MYGRVKLDVLTTNSWGRKDWHEVRIYEASEAHGMSDYDFKLAAQAYCQKQGLIFQEHRVFDEDPAPMMCLRGGGYY